MTKKRVLSECVHHIDPLIKYLENKYKSEGYMVQVLEIGDLGSLGKLFQVKNDSAQQWSTRLKNLTGLGTAGTAKLLKKGNDLEIEISGAKWLDKAAVFGVAIIVLYPLIITSGVGAWSQNKLLKKLDEDVLLYFTQLSEPTTLRPTVPTACPGCGAVITSSMKFCGNCGKQLA